MIKQLAAIVFARIRPVRAGAWRFATAKPLGAISVLLIVALGILALLAPWLAPVDPSLQNYDNLLAQPNRHFLLGTDDFGRDTLSRIIFGTRISLYVSVVGVGVGSAAGIIIGLTSGYFGGKLDMIAQRVVDMFMGFPTLVLAIVIVAMLGASVNNVALAVAMVAWPQTTRVVRSVTLGIKEQTYVEAARAMGASPARIIVRHILINALSSLLILLTALLAIALLVESSLSFLGLGPPPPTPSWGRMLSSSREFIGAAPWLAIFPGLFITAAIFSFSLLGDALRDYWDPMLRR